MKACWVRHGLYWTVSSRIDVLLGNSLPVRQRFADKRCAVLRKFPCALVVFAKFLLATGYSQAYTNRVLGNFPPADSSALSRKDPLCSSVFLDALQRSPAA